MHGLTGADAEPLPVDDRVDVEAGEPAAEQVHAGERCAGHGGVEVDPVAGPDEERAAARGDQAVAVLDAGHGERRPVAAGVVGGGRVYGGVRRAAGGERESGGTGREREQDSPGEPSFP